MKLQAHGVSAALPPGWDGRIRGRARTLGALALGDAIPGTGQARIGTMATLHAASFALTGEEGEFGAAATLRMPARGAFLSLVEYQPGDGLTPGVGLFASRTVPSSLAPDDFSSETMLVPRPGQAGVQRFFTVDSRPFCLYAVVGSLRVAPDVLPKLNAVLGSLVIA